MARVKIPEPEKDRSERWLLTYADMITLLLALFVVLFATSQIDQVRFEQVAASLQRAFHVPVLPARESAGPVPLGNLPNAFVGLTAVGSTIGPEVLSFAQREQLGDQVSVAASRDAVVITLSGALPFPSGSAELRPEARQLLDIVARQIRGLPERHVVRVEGHTDDQPTTSGRFPSNWDLSAARAGAAARALEESGVERDRIITVGYAETRPIADNSTPEGRQRNRRVEIWIVNADAAGPLAAPITPPVPR